jgi:hypothetical protein
MPSSALKLERAGRLKGSPIWIEVLGEPGRTWERLPNSGVLDNRAEKKVTHEILPEVSPIYVRGLEVGFQMSLQR